ncbi:MAG: hypothetical protein KA154_06980 [Gemmatimonadaceae bacterium]|nr:hypothetical protein [Gemmatimonadaceae bacterium]
MAAGDIVFYDAFLVNVQEKVFNLETDTIKLGLVTSTYTPTATDAAPCWGAGGTTNTSTNQVTPGGNYVTGGASVANPTVTLTGGAGVFDGDDVSIAQHASNPTNARWGVLYSDTATNKECLGYVDLGTTIDLSAGAFSVTWNASGIMSMNQA